MKYNFSNAIKTENIKFVNKVNGNGEIEISGTIGDSFFEEGYTFESFKEDLTKVKGDIVIKIASYGGDLFEALAIFDYIRSLKNNVTTQVVKATASAGTIISLAGDKRQITKNSRYLIHKVMVSAAMVNTDNLKEILEELESLDKQIIKLYADNTNLSSEEILELMRKDTFISAEEAIKMGFVDEYVTQKKRNDIKKADDDKKQKQEKNIYKQNNNKINLDMSKLFEILEVENEDQAIEKVAVLIENKEDQNKTEFHSKEEDEDEDVENKDLEDKDEDKDKDNEEEEETIEDKIARLEERISKLENPDEEEEEDDENKDLEDKDENEEEEEEDAQNKIARLEKQLKEKEIEETENKIEKIKVMVSEAVDAGKVTKETFEGWVDYGYDKGIEALTTMLNGIPEKTETKIKIEKPGLIGDTNEIINNWKTGKISTEEYIKLRKQIK